MNNITDKFLIQEPESLEKIGLVAAKIAYYNFEWRYVTLVMFASVQYVLGLESFLSNYKQSLVVKFGKFIPRHRNAVPQYIIFGQDAAEIIDIVQWLDKSQYDTAGKYIIICTSPDSEMCDETQVFITLSKVLIINIVYLRAKSDVDFLSFSYEIVNPSKCISSESYVVNLTDVCPFDDCYKDLYPEKLRNFNQCPLVISTFEQPPFMFLNNVTMKPSGVDGDIIQLVANVLNATLIVKTPLDENDWGQYENKNWTGSLGDVYNNRVHLSVCSLPVTESIYGNFQISFVYNYMDIVWTAELPLLKPAWQKLLNPFKVDMRIALFVIFIVIIITNTFIQTATWNKLREVVNIGFLRSNLLFYSWALFLGIPVLKMPSNRPLLLIVYSWIWFCFIVKSAYQAALIGSLKKQIYSDFFPDINSVLKNKHPYGGLVTLREYYIDDSHIYDNWIPMDFDEATETLDNISNGSSDFVLAINKEIVIEHLITHRGVRHVQILPEKIVNSPTVMYFKKHSVLAQPISHILSISVEAGFTQLPQRRFLQHKKLLLKRTSESYKGPLTFDNIKACMILLVFGWCLSLIFFAAEAYCGRLED